jgi:metal-responsive CopG/Arc/MetJ family transcriptional regulator
VAARIDAAAEAEDRSRSQQVTHLLRVGLAGREREAEHERKAAAIMAEQYRPDPGTTAARALREEHARLSGMPSPEDPT